ncbi:hypothetical protein V499_05760 [Pseudogymnoascus sp. VKM F-103]|nr:hypothetical protein V499_05760 [Pseudogymnoascus sp. VKM F-103]
MPDIDPAALSRPSLTSTTPILPPKSLSIVPPSAPKTSKSNHVPPRIDLEPLYTALKAAVGENWATYKEAVSLFVMGQYNQAELSAKIDWFLTVPGTDTEHLHNQLVAAIYGNVTREMPDLGVAAWVSANDKPTPGAGAKPITGDAAEQRLKAEVMSLPNRDRRRLKDLKLESDGPDPYTTLLSKSRHPLPTPSAPTTPSTSLSKTNWSLEIRKRFAPPLAAESGEFPDASTIEARMLPLCFEAGLVGGHAADASPFMAVAAETFVKQFLSSVFGRTRADGPSSGGGGWVSTRRYKRALEREEERWARGEVVRDKSGLLPVEAKAASERGALGMADLRVALEMGDCGVGQMPVVMEMIRYGFQEGEVEGWQSGKGVGDQKVGAVGAAAPDADVEMADADAEDALNGWGWEGAGSDDRADLNSLLDSCLASGS